MHPTPPVYTPETLPDAETLYGSLLVAVREEIKALPVQQVHLVGIYSGGAWLARRLHKDLKLVQPYGTLDVSFYRDDFDRIGLSTLGERALILSAAQRMIEQRHTARESRRVADPPAQPDWAT